MSTPKTAEQSDYYVPGAMTDDVRQALKEHLNAVGAWKQTIPAPSDPVLRAMTAGPRARTIGVHAATEAVLFLIDKADPETDAFEVAADLRRKLPIATEWGRVAVYGLYKRGQLVVDEQHRYILSPPTEDLA